MLVTLSVFIGIEGASVYSARTGAIATLYGPWPVYAAGLSYLLMCAVLFVPGILVHIRPRRGPDETSRRLRSSLLQQSSRSASLRAGQCGPGG